jgi:hypothetical protein
MAKVSGYIKANGSSASGVVKNISTSTPNVGVYGSTVVDNNDVDPIGMDSVISFNNKRPIAKKITKTINVFDSDALATDAAVPSLRRNVMKIESIMTSKITTAMRQGKYNIFTNSFSSTCGEGNDDCPDVVISDFGTDTAAAVSSSNKGNLFYTIGHKEPVITSYNHNS